MPTRRLSTPTSPRLGGTRTRYPTLSRDPGESPRMWSECIRVTNRGPSVGDSNPCNTILNYGSGIRLCYLGQMDVTDTFGKRISVTVRQRMTAALALERICYFKFGHVQRQYLTWKRAGFGRANLWHPAAAPPTVYESAFHDGEVRG